MSIFRFKHFSVENTESAMKVNTDGVLLGALMTVRPEDRMCLDIGTGTGTVALMAAQRMSFIGACSDGACSITGIDIDGASAREAGLNFAASPWPGMLRSLHLSLSDFAGSAEPHGFDHIFSNPPYYDLSLSAPDARRNVARHTDSLSYREIMKEMEYSIDDYLIYGGMPTAILSGSEMARTRTLESLVRTVYLQDIAERHNLKDDAILLSVLDVLCSSIGSLTNPQKIENTLRSKGRKIADDTVSTYIGYFQEAFLVEESKRYDIKGRDYLSTNPKYYIEDNGLRNVRLGMRQIEMSHLMESAIYLELLKRGYIVDTGTLPISTLAGDKRSTIQSEVDFVARKGSATIYIQSAYMIPDEKKEEQEKRPLMKIKDAYPRVIITRDGAKSHYDEDGILRLPLSDFLLEDNPFVPRM